MKRILLAGLAGLLVIPSMTLPAIAARPPRPPAMESVITMLVDGWLVIETDGGVLDVGIETDIPARLREDLDRVVRRWRFYPVVIDGNARRARSPMRITLATHKVSEGYSITVDHVLFPNPEGTSVAGVIDNGSVIISTRRRVMPEYPTELLRGRGVEGAVLLAIRVGRDGRVAEVIVRQSALYDVSGQDQVLRDVAELLEDSALQAVKRWKFNVQLKTDAPDPSDLTFLQQVHYTLEGPKQGARRTDSKAAPTLWRMEVRTARRPIPWIKDDLEEALAGVSDLRGGEMLPAGNRVRVAEGGAGDPVM